MKRKKWIAILTVILVLGGAALVAAKSKDKGDPKAENSPFRLGKVQAEDLQVSVREVGVVDPVTKVDVKSVVSGRVLSLKVREGAVVERATCWRGRARRQPGAVALRRAGERRARPSSSCRTPSASSRCRRRSSTRASSAATRSARPRSRDLAADNLRAAQMRYQIVEDHGIPISGNAASQNARVTSPMAGVVIKKGVELGETVTSGVSSFNAGTVIFTVADLKSLIIRVNLNEVDIAKVHVGQPVRITLDAYPQKVFTGKVRFVAPAAKLVEKIKVFKVEIALDELGDSFRTGMSANVEILGEKRDKAVSIPLEALQRRDGKTVAYRLKANLEPEADRRREGRPLGPQQVHLAVGELEGLLRRRPGAGRHRHARAGRDPRGPEGRRAGRPRGPDQEGVEKDEEDN